MESLKIFKLVLHYKLMFGIMHLYLIKGELLLEKNKLKTISTLFEGNEIRSIWDSEKEDYYFSIIDVITALTNSKIPKRYWTDLKRKLNAEGSQLYENIVQLKMKAKDGKLRTTDTLDTKGTLRLIESIPSRQSRTF